MCVNSESAGPKSAWKCRVVEPSEELRVDLIRRRLTALLHDGPDEVQAGACEPGDGCPAVDGLRLVFDGRFHCFNRA